MGLWHRITFQKVFLKSLIRLIIYLGKVYEDFGAVKTYRSEHALHLTIISMICLILPSLVFAIYQSISDYVKNDNSNGKSMFTKFVNGLLLMPWQIKRHLDGLYFSSHNLCSFREPREDEQENICYINRNAEVLEFFEDFYAGFIQVILQLYLLGMETNNKYSFIIQEVLVSGMAIFSMLIAIRRRDDGPLTGVLSFIGWISMFSSRVMSFALIAIIINYWILIPIMIHVLAFTIWIYKIAMRDLEEEPDENIRKKKSGFHTMILIFFFFGLPSLVMWPYMFLLKEKQRPLRFLIVMFIENTIMILLWYFLRQTKQQYDLQKLILVISLTLIAIVFLSLYFACKPSKVDQVVLHDMRYTDTDSYGIYFEFCDVVFNLKVKQEVRELLNEIRSMPELQPQSKNKQQSSPNSMIMPTAPDFNTTSA